jgi:hypothetical protein
VQPKDLGAFRRPQAQIERQRRHVVWTGDLHSESQLMHVFIGALYDRETPTRNLNRSLPTLDRHYDVIGREGKRTPDRIVQLDL